MNPSGSDLATVSQPQNTERTASNERSADQEQEHSHAASHTLGQLSVWQQEAITQIYVQKNNSN